MTDEPKHLKSTGIKDTVEITLLLGFILAVIMLLISAAK